MTGLFVFELYWNGVGGSTEPLLRTATRVLWVAAAGTALVGLGVWLRRIEA